MECHSNWHLEWHVEWRRLVVFSRHRLIFNLAEKQEEAQKGVPVLVLDSPCAFDVLMRHATLVLRGRQNERPLRHA